MNKEKKESVFCKTMICLLGLLAISYLGVAAYNSYEIATVPAKNLPPDQPLNIASQFLLGIFFTIMALSLLNKKINQMLKSAFQKTEVLDED